jgi:autoinducer 2-degrading protein
MLIFQFHHFIKPDMIEAYKEAILKNAHETMKEPGVIRFDVLQDKEDPSHFALFEVYRDMEAREHHLQTAHFFSWKEVALEAFDRKGYGHEYEAVHPEEGWEKG